MLQLHNGDLILTLIVRVDVQDVQLASYRRGLEAVLSHDRGQTWEVAGTYVLDALPFLNRTLWYNGKCGHLSSTLLDDGSLVAREPNYLTKGVSLIRWKPASR